jgi:hypothetical protein
MSNLGISSQNSMVFYERQSYSHELQRNFSRKQTSPLSDYIKWTISPTHFSKTRAFSWIRVNTYLYFLIHHCLGKYTGAFPSACPWLFNKKSNSKLHRIRQNIPTIIRMRNKKYNERWVIQRISIEVEGYKIDALIMGQKSTIKNKRWTLVSGGNSVFYEDYFVSLKKLSQMCDIFKGCKSNAIFFNYPGVAESEGYIDRELINATYRAFITYLEDPISGLGAKEIIGWGYSMGGAIQGDALCDYKFSEGIKHVFVKSRTYSSFEKEIKHFKGSFLSMLVPLFGWDINPLKFALSVKKPEIILQTIEDKPENQEAFISLKLRKFKVIHDGIIPAEASLAQALLKHQDHENFKYKLIIGHKETHSQPYQDISFLCEMILGKLENPKHSFLK